MSSLVPAPSEENQSPRVDPAAAESPKVQQRLQVSQAFSGPIPPPGMLAEYNRISDGLALRLVAHAESEAHHRRAMESRIVEAEIADRKAHYSEARCGQLCALVIALAALGAGSYTALNGKEIAGSVLGLSGIGGIVTTFIMGRQASKPRDEPDSQEEKPPSKTKRSRKK